MNDFPDEIPGPATMADDAGADAPRPADVAVERLQKEKDELRDRLLRLSAEFDNYRKRIDRERRETSERAVAGVLEDLLPVIDDFERALKADASSGDTYREGVSLIHRQLMDVLTRRGVTPIEAVGTDFDPHVHQAVAYEESPGHREGQVVEEMRRGYRIGDRLLRPAMVKVAKG